MGVMTLLMQRQMCPRGHRGIPQGQLARGCLVGAKHFCLKGAKPPQSELDGWVSRRKVLGSLRKRFCSYQGRCSEKSLQEAFKNKRQQTKYSKKASNYMFAIQRVPVSRL